MPLFGREADMADIKHPWWNTLEIDSLLGTRPKISDRISIQSISQSLQILSSTFMFLKDSMKTKTLHKKDQKIIKLV